LRGGLGSGETPGRGENGDRSTCAPQILRADLEMAGLLCVLVPQGTRTGENGRVLFPDAS
jgi:hypothetical protein